MAKKNFYAVTQHVTSIVPGGGAATYMELIPTTNFDYVITEAYWYVATVSPNQTMAIWADDGVNAPIFLGNATCPSEPGWVAVESGDYTSTTIPNGYAVMGELGDSAITGAFTASTIKL
jgi:hypothetical protein